MSINHYKKSDRYSVAVTHGNTIYLTGQTSRKETIKEQTAEVLEKIEAILADNKSDKDHMLSVTIYLKNMDDFDAMNEVYDAWVSKNTPPTRACVEAKMARDCLLVEMKVIAAVIE
ncbi:MAG: hypothetical protein CSA15_08175 [Candidatus Delongbacteria bacterium]|nr:MAG: hypothetical protein CSA15_08175 [Candidatus Delongbacteria bacterium]